MLNIPIYRQTICISDKFKIYNFIVHIVLFCHHSLVYEETYPLLKVVW